MLGNFEHIGIFHLRTECSTLCELELSLSGLFYFTVESIWGWLQSSWLVRLTNWTFLHAGSRRCGDTGALTHCVIIGSETTAGKQEPSVCCDCALFLWAPVLSCFGFFLLFASAKGNNVCGVGNSTVNADQRLRKLDAPHNLSLVINW